MQGSRRGCGSSGEVLERSLQELMSGLSPVSLLAAVKHPLVQHTFTECWLTCPGLNPWCQVQTRPSWSFRSRGETRSKWNVTLEKAEVGPGWAGRSCSGRGH